MDPYIFREYDIRGIVGDQLTDDVVLLIARGVGTFFSNNGVRRVALGFDARASSAPFAKIFEAGLHLSGVDVVTIGRVPTPVLYYAVHTTHVGGGVMITGSHNPPDHNGFKICLGKDALFGSQILEIRDIITFGRFSEGSGTSEKLEILGDYQRDLLSRLSMGTRMLKVVVDAGNGMGGITAVPAYKELGVTLLELYTQPDASFPNHHPDPTVEANLAALVTAVKQSGADAGIAFDGDGDRIGVVDENGRILWGDELMVIYSREVLHEHPGAMIIAEVKCSQTLFDDINHHGGTPLMWKAGHSLIKAKMKETGAILAGEMSGHMFFADRFYGFDDACYAGARLLEILSKNGRRLSELTADLPKTYSTPELRIACADDRKFEVVAKVARHFARTNAVNTIDGARISFDHGWGLVRASNTQALLVLRFEADSDKHLTAIMESVGEFMLDLEGAIPLRHAVEDSTEDLERAIALRELGELERRSPLTQGAALRHYQACVDILRKLDEPLRLAHTIRHLGLIHEEAGRLAQAADCYGEALRLYREHSTENDLGYANAVRYAAAVKEKCGDTEEARELWRESRMRYEELKIPAGVDEADDHLSALRERS